MTSLLSKLRTRCNEAQWSEVTERLDLDREWRPGPSRGNWTLIRQSYKWFRSCCDPHKIITPCSSSLMWPLPYSSLVTYREQSFWYKFRILQWHTNIPVKHLDISINMLYKYGPPSVDINIPFGKLMPPYPHFRPIHYFFIHYHYVGDNLVLLWFAISTFHETKYYSSESLKPSPNSMKQPR